MTDVLIPRKIDPENVTRCYHQLVDVGETYAPEEMVTAIISYLGVQWKGNVMPEAEMQRYVKNITEWLAMYFHEGEKQ